MNKFLRFSYIHLIGWGDWREQQGNVSINSRSEVCKKTNNFFLMFLLPKSDSHFLKFIYFLVRKKKKNQKYQHFLRY